MASTAALEQEEFDDAFWREVDAAEAAAVLEQQGQNTSSSTCTVGEDLSPTMTQPQKRSNQETCQKDGSSVEGMLRYRWKVASISVHGDGSKIEEEWIGEGELAVNCRQVSPSGAIQLENVVVTADGGGGSAMDIPRHAMTHFSTDGGSASPLEPIPVTREPPSPPFLLLLGLGIGCSIIMSGLTLLGDHELPPRVGAGESCYRSRNVGRGTDSIVSTTSDGRDTAAAAAAVVIGLPRKPQLAPTQLALPIATPERRRLAPTEFATPSSRPLSAPPQDKDNRDHDRAESESEMLPRAEMLDPVLARLVYDFSQDGSLSSSPLPTASCSGNSDTVGIVELPIARPSALASGKDVDGMLPTTVDRPPRVAWSTGNNNLGHDSTVALDRGQVLSSGRKDEDTEKEVTAAAAAAAAGLSPGGEKADGEPRAAVANASAGSPKATERWHDFGDDASRDGGAGDYGDGVKRKVRRIAGPKKEGGVTVPDGEWRRPLVASPPNRRRSAAGRRMPKVRDGARNRNGGVVVLRLDDDDNDRESSTSGAAVKPAASSRGSNVRRAGAAVHRIGVGVGGSAGVGEGQQHPELGEHPGKRLLPTEIGGHPSYECLSRKRTKVSPPPQPRSLHTAAGALGASNSKGESSWLALRRALHERYRDSEEHGAAEQAAAEAAEHGRGGRGGSSKGGRGGCGGEVMSPGVRVFRRQDHAFAYVDTLAARLAAEDAARYRVLSFETNATGSRKFIVCDVRRFEERYPYTALPDPSLLRHLLLPAPTNHRQAGSPSSPPPPPPPPQSTPPHVSYGPSIADDNSDRGECDGNPGDGRKTGDIVCSSATTTTTTTMPPTSLETLELPQTTACPARSEARSGLSSVGPAFDKPSHPPSPCPPSPTPRPSPLRHVYEIIREGCPCRMYFDLEFARGPNPGLDGEELVRAWINVVAGKLHQEFGVSVGASNVLDLDSSTPKKFSRHLIFHLPGDQLFLDNSHVGRFVNSLAAELESWRAPQSPSTPATPPGSCCDGIVPTAAAAAAAAAAPHYGSGSGGGNTGGRDHLGGTPASDDFASTAAVPMPTVATVPREGDGDVSTGLTPTTTATAPTTTKADGSNDDKTNGGGGGGAGALERLWVKDGDGRRVLFADVSVYTRNRCFRLLGSSKFGKAACLRVAATNQRTLDRMVWKGRRGGAFAHTSSSSSSSLSPQEQKQQLRDVARTLLHDSLVVPTTPRSSPAGRFLTVGGGAGQHRFSRFGSCRNQTGDLSSSQQRHHHHHGWSTNGTMPAERDGHRGNSQDQGSGSSDGDGWRVSSQGFGPSPFPAVDSFLRTLVCQGGSRGELRQWSYTAGQVPSRTIEHDNQEGNGNGGGSGNAGGTGLSCPGSQSAPRSPATVVRRLTHQVANNRWCWNIGRAHKSNHVFLVTDLSRGEVRQHCHDQECRRSGYRSNPVRLPIGVAPSEDDLEAFELELGLAAAMRESPADWAAVA
ncbi:unnamed protein product [Ectocarpus fasciculatus]